MPTPILATKLHIPPPRPKAVMRPRLLEILNRGLESKLTLISAPAGFGKTTLISEWVSACLRPVLWLSLDEGDNDAARFLAYLAAALQPLARDPGKGPAGFLPAPMPPSSDSILTALLNGIVGPPDHATLILDDYHLIHSQEVDRAVAFLIEHLPPRLHLVIATRENPRFPLARLRARGGLTELKASDLRFTRSEAAGFLNQVMGLDLSPDDIASLETRTEGWVAGLQLAAISMQGHEDTAGFIHAFTGSHHFVADYLIEEVLHRQPVAIQSFLLRTSMLERMCGPLCDAVLADGSSPGDETLQYLERANLFIVPLDNERRWYRYHHLFADLLRERLRRSLAKAAWSKQDASAGQDGFDAPAETAGEKAHDLPALHRRACLWYEAKDLSIEAFHHAAAAEDVGLASRLILGEGMPLPFRGAVVPVLHWLESQPKEVLDANPALWVTYTSTLMFAGQTIGIEPKLQAAEAALRLLEPDERTRDLIGRIAASRATLALMRRDAGPILSESRRALEYLHPDNLYYRTATTWKLGYAYQLQGDRGAAHRAYTDAVAEGRATGNKPIILLASMGLGTLQESDNRLPLACETYRGILESAGEPALPGSASEAHLGLARIAYQWNDLEGARRHYQQSVPLARQLINTDRFAAGEVFSARLKLAQGDVDGASALLAKIGQLVRQNDFALQVPEVAALQVLVLLRKGRLKEASLLARTRGIPGSLARVRLAQGDAPAALALLEPLCREMETKGWEDLRLQMLVLQAMAFQAHGDMQRAIRILGEALERAMPGGLIRVFVDEGLPMAALLVQTAAQGFMPGFVGTLLRAFEKEEGRGTPGTRSSRGAKAKYLSESLSQRELEVLRLVAQGQSNAEISRRLFLSLSTVKGHNLNIFGKLQVQRRTEAVVRGRELGLV